MPGPEHLAGGGELVEHRGLVVGDAGGQHQRLQRRGGYGAPGELLDHGDHAVDAAEAAADVLPGGQEPRQRDRLDRLDLVAQPGQRPSPQGAQHLGVTPLGARARGPELALEHASLGGEPGQRLVAHGDAEAEPLGHLGGGERPVRAGIAADQVAQRVLDRLGEHVRARPAAPGRRGRRAAGRRPRRRPSAPGRTSAPAPPAGQSTSISIQSVTLSGVVQRAWISSVESGPSMRNRSAMPSLSRTRRSSASRWSSDSTSASTSGSSSSRSSARPSSSASRPWSRVSAAARRSAMGESPSYMNAAT